ncbi:MAG: UDP-N-acetylglucosamine 1-carboxyvinyltransferase [Christensenellales bacterium]|jgi:UDP-N-acetylglucosamine 1-carboxyvinyltransferase
MVNKNVYKKGKHLKITNSGPLCGTCDVSTSKNAVLPILAASLLTQEPVVIRKIPKIDDVNNMISLLKTFGAEVKFTDDTLTICTKTILTTSPNEHMVGKLRASFLFMGPLLAREGCVTMPLPGGCRIGLRPIDLHIKGFKALGAKAITAYGHVITWRSELVGNTIYLDYPSVGATENVLMAACLAKGITTIVGAAAEPEVTDLIRFLVSMGANISMGANRITIVGTRELSGTDYTPIPDRIEAGTLMLAAAVTGGDVCLNRANVEHLKPVSLKLVEAGTEIFPYPEGLRIVGKGVRPLDIVSSPYPGFPTDMQAPFMAACCAAKGISTVNETVFENRFLHVAELKKMGADIEVAGNIAVVTGTGRLSGAEVCATDLRAGAALCIAGLIAQEETIINDIYHLDRGYDDLEGKFKKLGARIERM